MNICFGSASFWRWSPSIDLCTLMYTYFNGKTIETVKQYGYLGVMTSRINHSQTFFPTNRKHLHDKARWAVFSMHKKIKWIRTLLMKIAFHLCQYLIQPILLFGIDIWGIGDPAKFQIDTFSHGSFAVPFVWNPPHPLPWSMASVDRYQLVYGCTSVCWHIMPISITCRRLEW